MVRNPSLPRYLTPSLWRRDTFRYSPKDIFEKANIMNSTLAFSPSETLTITSRAQPTLSVQFQSSLQNHAFALMMFSRERNALKESSQNLYPNVCVRLCMYMCAYIIRDFAFLSYITNFTLLCIAVPLT